MERGETAAPTLKGVAITAAIEAGLVQRLPSGDGYNIAPFLKFWDLFAKKAENAFQNDGNFSEMVKKEGNQGAKKQKQDIPSETGTLFFPFL